MLGETALHAGTGGDVPAIFNACRKIYTEQFEKPAGTNLLNQCCLLWIRASAVRYYPDQTCNICRCPRITFPFGNNYVKVFFGSSFCSFETILPIYDYSAVERRHCVSAILEATRRVMTSDDVTISRPISCYVD